MQDFILSNEIWHTRNEVNQLKLLLLPRELSQQNKQKTNKESDDKNKRKLLEEKHTKKLKKENDTDIPVLLSFGSFNFII